MDGTQMKLSLFLKGREQDALRLSRPDYSPPVNRRIAGDPHKSWVTPDHRNGSAAATNCAA
jgi:hypothetical protein